MDDDTYASTPVFTILKVLITIALALGWSMLTCDVSTAFLHADLLDYDLFMIPPKEYYPNGGIYWKLKKAMYGLKGAPKAWQDHFAKVIVSLGFVRLRSDANVYVDFVTKIVILVYVDDLLLFGTLKSIMALYETLDKHFVIRITGTLDKDNDTVKFLGRILTRFSDSVSFSMPDGYFDEAFEHFKIKDITNYAKTPSTKALSSADDDSALDTSLHKLYRRFVGKLQWVSPIRPDLSYTIKELARWLTTPTTKHLNQLKHCMRYIRGTLHYKYVLRPLIQLASLTTTIDLVVYVDSDWAGCAETRKSTSGVIIQLLGSSVTAISRTQSTRALSSGEAEMYAVGTGMCEGLHLRNFLLEARLCNNINIIVFTDSTAGKAMSTRFGTSKKTRHVHLKFLFVQDLVQEGVTTLKKVLGTENPADVCTKPVDVTTLLKHLGNIGMTTTREQRMNYIGSIQLTRGQRNHYDYVSRCLPANSLDWPSGH